MNVIALIYLQSINQSPKTAKRIRIIKKQTYSLSYLLRQKTPSCNSTLEGSNRADGQVMFKPEEEVFIDLGTNPFLGTLQTTNFFGTLQTYVIHQNTFLSYCNNLLAVAFRSPKQLTMINKSVYSSSIRRIQKK